MGCRVSNNQSKLEALNDELLKIESENKRLAQEIFTTNQQFSSLQSKHQKVVGKLKIFSGRLSTLERLSARRRLTWQHN